MRMVLFAQSILEYSGSNSRASVVDTLRSAASALADGLEDIEPRTWMIISGVLLVLVFLTRHSRQH